MLTFIQYSANLIVRPRVALRAMLTDPRRVAFGFMGLLTLTAIYLLNISILIAKNLYPTELLVLRIPREQYYVYERFFLLPVAIGGTILSAGAIRLTARLWGGQGHFEDLFALLSFSLIVIAIVIGLPDLGIYIFAPKFKGFGPHVLIGTLWGLFLTVLVVKEAENLSWGKSIAIAIIGSLANGAVQFVFIR